MKTKQEMFIFIPSRVSHSELPSCRLSMPSIINLRSYWVKRAATWELGRAWPWAALQQYKWVRMKCMRTNVVRALADVVATKLGIICYFPFFLSSMHVLFYVQIWGRPKDRSRGTHPKDLFFLVGSGGVRALWVSEYPPRLTHIGNIFSIEIF